MNRNPLSPKDLTNVLNRYQGSLCRRSPIGKVPSNRQEVHRREGSQSTCDRMALGLLILTVRFFKYKCTNREP